LGANYREFTIIIPTLNEGKTIGRMLEYVLRNCGDARIIVADDGSVDGTREIVGKFAARNGRITLMERPEGSVRGLTASVTGAMELSRTKFAVVLDADMQHPPEKIGEIAERLEEGNNLVVATRAEVTEWDFCRKAISRLLICIGGIVLLANGNETCGDIFSGFFGVERGLFVGVLEKNRGRFVGEGYKVLFDFLKCVDRGTLKISEVPFVFKTREFGSSKVGFAQGVALLKSFVT
jgi:dolichol-phosphate mannosyltransferase